MARPCRMACEGARVLAGCDAHSMQMLTPCCRYLLPRPIRLAFFGGSAASCLIASLITAARLLQVRTQEATMHHTGPHTHAHACVQPVPARAGPTSKSGQAGQHPCMHAALVLGHVGISLSRPSAACVPRRAGRGAGPYGVHGAGRGRAGPRHQSHRHDRLRGDLRSRPESRWVDGTLMGGCDAMRCDAACAPCAVRLLRRCRRAHVHVRDGPACSLTSACPSPVTTATWYTCLVSPWRMHHAENNSGLLPRRLPIGSAFDQ